MFVISSRCPFDLTQRCIKCRVKYENAIKNYLYSYCFLLTKVPNDIVKIIMKDLNPRVISKCSGQMYKGTKYTTLHICNKCFLKVRE